jgi:predicted phosphoribosyltransferase
MMFQDRLDAARQLTQALDAYRDRHPLVLAIPRGAVPMAKLIAQELGGEFDVVLVRKLRSPYASEVAVGSVDESGWTYVAPHAASFGADQDYLAAEKHQQLLTIQSRRAQYTPIRPPIDPAGRTVIVVDDGLATGATMIAALHGLRHQQPARLICALPVAAPDALERVRPLADEVICLCAPGAFQAVGQFYRHFDQVEDEEVIALLRG